jgi:hypothetical protein
MSKHPHRPTPAMNLERFSVIVDAYGCSPARWPADERDAAQAFAKSSAEAQQLLTQAEKLDFFLDAIPDYVPSPALRVRVVEAASRPRTWQDRLKAFSEQFWPFGSIWKPVAVLGMAGVMGLATGFSLNQAQTTDDTSQVSSTDEVANELALNTDFGWDTP